MTHQVKKVTYFSAIIKNSFFRRERGRELMFYLETKYGQKHDNDGDIFISQKLLIIILHSFLHHHDKKKIIVSNVVSSDSSL